MEIKEQIENLKNTLSVTDDDELKSYVDSKIKSLEREEKITNEYNNIIKEVVFLLENSDIDNEVQTSNKLIGFISILKELNNDNGKKLINDLQNIFKDISNEDSEEIMKHVYSTFLFRFLRNPI